jgi:hypothetical protein
MLAIIFWVADYPRRGYRRCCLRTIAYDVRVGGRRRREVGGWAESRARSRGSAVAARSNVARAAKLAEIADDTVDSDSERGVPTECLVARTG